MFDVPGESKSELPASAQSAAAAPPQIDLLKICSTLWAGKTTMLATTVAALLLAAAFVLFAPHRYTAVAEILIDPVDLRAVANEATPSTQQSDTALLLIDSQVRVLSSDDVLRRVVESQDLAHDSEFVGKPSALRVLANFVLSALGRPEPVVADPSLAALTSLRRHMRVTRAERTYVVDVAVSSELPAKAAQLANGVAQAYLAEQTAVRADAARQISQSLRARLSELKESVHQAEERVEEFKASHNIVDANGQLINEQQLSDLNNQLAAARAGTAAAKARLDEIEAVQNSKVDIGAFPAAVQSPTITALRSQYAEVMRVEAQQSISLGTRHPAVIEIRAQADRLKRMIDDEVNRIALAARADYQSARSSEAQTQRNVDGLKQNALTTDAAIVNLRELQRDVQASRAVYEAFLTRARETGAQEGVDTKNIQVISRADVPFNRTFPPSNTIMALAALFLGVAAGGGLVLLRDTLPVPTPRLPANAFSRRTRASKPMLALPPVEAPGIVPILAKLPDVEASPEAKDGPDPRFAAGVNAVYEAVRDSHKESGNPSILVVASDDDKDTAAVALTLAALAAEKQSVLLIDADIERRTLAAIDADRGEAGLVDVAVGRRLLADAVIRDRDTNISLLPFVSPHSRRDRNIMDDDIKVAFAQTKDFDTVIVTATDAGRDPAARFFAGLVDHIVVVTTAAAAEAGAIDTFVSRLGIDARKVRGAVLTGAPAA